jgi:cytochrome c
VGTYASVPRKGQRPASAAVRYAPYSGRRWRRPLPRCCYQPTPLVTPCFAYYNGSGTTACPQLFPELGPGGGVGPHGASPYDFDRRLRSPGKFPEYYDGSFIFGEFTRDYLREVRLDSRGGIFKINNVLNCGSVNVPPQPPTVPTPERPFDCDAPMDAKFGRDGNFYLLTTATAS